MKRKTVNHSKFHMLVQTLNIPRYCAAGILELLWNYAADYIPTGDLSKLSPRHIAGITDWRGDPDELVEALVLSGWLDRDGDKLFIHDWADHCEDSVHRALARAGQRFADGSVPSFRRLNRRERCEAEQAFDDDDRDGPEPGSPTSAERRYQGRTSQPTGAGNAPNGGKNAPTGARNAPGGDPVSDPPTDEKRYATVTSPHSNDRPTGAQNAHTGARHAPTDSKNAPTGAQNAPGVARNAHMGARHAQFAHEMRPAEADADAEASYKNAEEEIRPGTGPSLGGPPASRGRNGPTSASASVSANTHQTRTPRGRDRGGPPQPLAQILGTAPTASAEEYAAQIVELTVEGEEYRAWWLETIRRMERTGGMGVFDEGVRYVRDCADPATRQAKDLGELRNPGAYLARRCRDWLHRHGRRLPAAPQAAEASG